MRHACRPGRPGDPPPSGTGRRDHGPRLTQLLARVADRDKAAFRELYTLTSGKHFAIALRILPRRDLAEEVVQDIAVTIWTNAGRYDPQHGRPAAWMNAIARNHAIDRLRRERARPEAADHPAEEIGADMTDDVLARITLTKLVAAIRQDYRRALLLSYFQGYTDAELARVLDVPIGTAKSWLRRGLLALAELSDPPGPQRHAGDERAR